jgi:hypothetical protein
LLLLIYYYKHFCSRCWNTICKGRLFSIICLSKSKDNANSADDVVKGDNQDQEGKLEKMMVVVKRYFQHQPCKVNGFFCKCTSPLAALIYPLGFVFYATAW